MMTGYLAQKHNIRIGDKRVGKALGLVNPENHRGRRNDTTRMLNPIPLWPQVTFGSERETCNVWGYPCRCN